MSNPGVGVPGDVVTQAQAALERASRGDWTTAQEFPAWGGFRRVVTTFGIGICREVSPSDAEFIVAAHTLIPELVAEIQWLRSVNGDPQ